MVQTVSTVCAVHHAAKRVRLSQGIRRLCGMYIIAQCLLVCNKYPVRNSSPAKRFAPEITERRCR